MHAVRPAGAERGATSVEYALVATLIAIAVFGAVMLLGTNTLGLYDRVASTVSSIAP